jgi:secreted Zn-dependent insulinase-like peptidase
MLTYALRLAAFVDTVAQTVAAHRPSDNLKIARYKDQISRELKAFDNQQPYQQVLSLLALLVQKYKY